MTGHESISERIPWYVNGTLDRTASDELERHLVSCADCRAQLETARRLEAIADADELLDHPQAQHLDSFATRPGSLPSDLAAWIREHLARCPACAGAVERLRPAEKPSWHRVLFGIVLHPAAAAAYLLVLAVGIPVYLFDRPAPRSAGGAVDLPVLSSPMRGEAGTTIVELPPDGSWVLLGAEFDLGETSGPLRFVVTRGEDTVWTTEMAGQRAAAALARSGIVTLLVPAGRLPVGSYLLTVEAPEAGRPLLRARFRTQRQSPAARNAPQ